MIGNTHLFKMLPEYRLGKTLIWTGISLMLIHIGGCEKRPTPPSKATKSMAELVGSPANAGQTMGQATFAPVVPGLIFEFPRDHLAHRAFRQEWWYLTTNLTTERGEALGAQWTQFRVALKPMPSDQSKQADWQTEQIYFAHSALTSSDTHLAHEKWSRQHPEFAHVNSLPYRVRLDNWTWQSETDALFPATLTVDNPDFSYKLTLSSRAPLQYQGDQGYSIKSRDGQVASYYYSQPFIHLSGQITRQGKVERVTGQGWLDREWSSQFLTKNQQGWDWFALRLDDGSALMLFQLRDQSQGETAKHTATSAFYSARRMFADGSGRNINSTDQANDIQLTPLKWQHTAKGDYPVSWRVQIHSEDIDLTISPLNPDSVMPLSTSYWEGPITLSGSHSGTGYMELTGY